MVLVVVVVVAVVAQLLGLVCDSGLVEPSDESSDGFVDGSNQRLREIVFCNDILPVIKPNTILIDYGAQYIIASQHASATPILVGRAGGVANVRME